MMVLKNVYALLSSQDASCCTGKELGGLPGPSRAALWHSPQHWWVWAEASTGGPQFPFAMSA